VPVIAVGVAIAADVAATAAVAGAVAASALTVSTALAVTAAVGATLGAVGAVTRDKGLQIAGTVIGAIGAVGSLASAAGVIDGGTSLFGAAPAASTADASAAGAVDTMAGQGGSISDAAASAAPAPASSGGLINATPGGVGAVDPASGQVITGPAAGVSTAPDVGTTTEASAATNAAPPVVGTELSPQDAAALQTNVQAAQAGGTNSADLAIASPTAPAATPPNTTLNPGVTSPPPAAGAGTSASPSDLISTPPAPPGGLGATDPATGETITQSVDPVTGKIVSLPDGSSGVLGSLLSFAGKNPVVALGALQAGGSLLSGLTSTLTPAQVGALNAQAAANNAAAALQKQQTANLAMPKSVASSSPVTGTPQQLVPGSPSPSGLVAPQQPVTGFINQAPKAA
jgi:hypothetical protein